MSTSTRPNGEPSTGVLEDQYEQTKAKYWEMENKYKKLIEAENNRPDVAELKNKLSSVRYSYQHLLLDRNDLLDRILQLESSLATSGDRQKSLPRSRIGTDQEERLKEKLLTAFREPLDVESDPYKSSRHIGPVQQEEHAQKVARLWTEHNSRPHAEDSYSQGGGPVATASNAANPATSGKRAARTRTSKANNTDQPQPQPQPQQNSNANLPSYPATTPTDLESTQSSNQNVVRIRVKPLQGGSARPSSSSNTISNLLNHNDSAPPLESRGSDPAP